MNSCLLSDRGCLIYVARVFPGMRPYLKGIHLTVDSWRDGRVEEEGWKDRAWCGSEDEPGKVQPEALEFVKGVKTLLWDPTALRILFSADHPAVRVIRPTGVIYGFGDASGSDFKSSFTHASGIVYQASWGLGIRRRWRVVEVW
jgi:hypothetical protein